MNKKVNINNHWLFTKEPCTLAQVISKANEPISLPHTWNAEDGVSGGNNYHRGLCWYVKEIEFIHSDGRIFLDFEAANSVSQVYLNMQWVGEHKGGYSGFRFDVTDIVADGKNTLIVGVDNSHIEDVYPLFADFTFYGGIYRDVNIIYTNQVYFEKMDLASSGIYISQKAISEDLADIHFCAKIRNTADIKSSTITISWLDADDQEIFTLTDSFSIKNEYLFEKDIQIKDPILWNGIDNPYLYKVVVTLSVDGTVMDSESIPIGLRYYEFNENGFFLNGKYLKLKGVSRHQDRAGVGNALTKDHQREDISLIKEVGANSIRLAHYQHNQYFYDLCDQTGMVVWAEIPYISRLSKSDPSGSNAKSQMHELIRQNYNHPSILMWGVQNEIGMMEEEKSLEQISREMHDIVKEEDITRVTTQAQVMMIEVDDPAHHVTDIVAYNKYYGWYVGQAEDFDTFIQEWHDEYPTKPLGFSEYGAEGIIQWHSDEPEVKDYSEEYQALYHEKCMHIFNAYDFVWGSYVWNFFDFGSDLRDEGGIKGMNNKGLVTFDRTIKKDAFYFYQSIWSQKPMLHITSKRFIDRHLDHINIKIYSNLKEVELYVNNHFVERKSSDNTLFTFLVELTDGKTLIEAKAGNLSDQALFNKVAQANTSYILPKDQRQSLMDTMMPENGNVTNWFDMDLDTTDLTFNYPGGYYNIRNKITELIAYEETASIFDKYLAGARNHGSFELIQEMSLKAVMDFQPETFPKEAQVYINNQLNKIKKETNYE